jgi:mitochondrial fission protein ELM1
LRAPKLAAARRFPDPRLSVLPTPRIAIVLGGTSAHHQFKASDIAQLRAMVAYIVRQVGGVMITPSRRTPEAVKAAVAEEIASFSSRSFMWDGRGENPYLNIMALADAVIVTGDSVNMVGEAVATGVPVHVFEPSGGHEKVTQFIDALEAQGAVRRWKGFVEQWTYAPLDATATIADFIAKNYQRHCAARR